MQRIEKLVLPTNFPIGPIHAYLVFGEKLTLIDTGLKTDQAWKELNIGLERLGLKLTEIEQIVLTHHHNDHVGLLDWILEKHPTVPVFAHRDTLTFLQDEDYLDWTGEFFKTLLQEFGLPKEMAYKWAFRKRGRTLSNNLEIETVLQEGDKVPGLSDWQVIETLGHSQDHLSLYNAKDQMLICGDHIIKGMHSGIFLDAPLYGKPRARPLIQYFQNLEKCKNLPIKLTYSGHGPDIDHLVEVIKATEENIENRLQRVINALKKANGSATGFEIIQDVYRRRYEKAVITFVFEIVAVLDLLEERNIIIAEKTNGVYHYRLVDY